MALWHKSANIPCKRRKYLWRTVETPVGYPAAWCRRGTSARWECVFAEQWSEIVGFGETRNQALADLIKRHEARFGVIV